MKTNILSILTITAALVAAAPDSQEKQDPLEAAKRAVEIEIVARVVAANPQKWSRPSFSRVQMTRKPRATYQAPLLADGEERLPFSLPLEPHGKNSSILTGYVRLSDQRIFLLDPATKMYRAAQEDPRFAKQPALAAIPEAKE